MTNKLLEIGAELDRESCTWLEENHPLLFDAIELAVIRDVSPAEIRMYVLRQVGGERTGIANRCEGAARHLIAQKMGA